MNLKKLFSLALVAWSVTGAWAQTSPYTGTAVAEGEEFYLYNVESGLWLQNNDSKMHDWHTRGAIGTRGLDFKLTRSGGGYLINGKLGKKSLASGNNYLDSNDTDVWTFESVEKDGVSNAYKIYCGVYVLGTVYYDEAKAANNLFTQTGTKRWYLENPDFNKNMTERNTWQIVTKEERLAKLATATEGAPQDASWLVPSADFVNNDTRFSLWTRTNSGGDLLRTGDANGDFGRGSMIMSSVNSNSFDMNVTISSLPNGKYTMQLQGFYRDGTLAEIASKHDGGTEVLRAKYYANGVEGSLRSIIDGTTVKEAGPNNHYWAAGSYFVPDNSDIASAQRCMNKTCSYVNDPIEFYVVNGKATIGVKKTSKSEGDWTVFDNIKLTYYGPLDLSGYLTALNNAIAEAEGFTGVTTTALQNALDNALAEARDARTSEDPDVLNTKTLALSEALDAARAVNAADLKATIDFAEAESLTGTELNTDFVSNNVLTDAQTAFASATTQEAVNNALAELQRARRVFHAERHDMAFAGNEPAAGDFYLYNVGQKQFFCGGSDFGAHAALGWPGIVVTLEKSGDGYIVNTHLNNGGTSQYLSASGYCDTGSKDVWVFQDKSAGGVKKYNMLRPDNHAQCLGFNPNFQWTRKDYDNLGSSMTNFDNSNNQWILVTKAERDALLDAATELSPVDASYLIKMPNFSQREFQETGGWDGTESSKAWYHYNGGIWDRGGNHPDFVFESWNAETLNLSQTVTGLRPGGIYKVMLTGYFRDGDRDQHINTILGSGTPARLAKLYINGDEAAALPSIDSEGGRAPGLGWKNGVGEFPDKCTQAADFFELGLYKVESPKVVVDEDGKLTISIQKSGRNYDRDWVVVDNFRLVYYGQSGSYVADEGKEYMPLPVKSGFNVDVIAENTPVENYTSATGLDDSNAMLYTDGVDAAGGLPASGNIVTLGGNKYFVDYTQNNGVKMTSTDPYVLTLSDQANAKAIYVLGISANGASTVSVVANYTDGTSSSAAELSIRDWVSAAGPNLAVRNLGRFNTRTATETGDKVFCLYETKLNTDKDKKIKSVTLTKTSGGDPTILAVSMYGTISKELSLTNGYATFSAGQDYQIETAGVDAYKAVSQSGNYIILEALTDGIPANTGVVLYGEGQSTVSLKAVDGSTSDASGNMMRANVSDYDLPAEAGGYKHYTLGLDPDDASVCVFRPSDGTGTLAAGKAYLAIPTGGEAKYFITFGDETGIQQGMRADESADAPMYNVQGQRVTDTYKGVVIVGGKKVVK